MLTDPILLKGYFITKKVNHESIIQKVYEKNNILLSIVFAILVSSCVSRKHYSSESYFISSDLEKINGKYFMDRKSLYDFFNIKASDYYVKSTNKYYRVDKTTGDIFEPISKVKCPQDSIDLDFILVSFNGKDSLNIIYRDSELWYKKSYKGKLKKNYFEIVLQNKRYPFFPIASRHDVDKIRVGLSQSGDLLVHSYSEHWGTFLLFGAHAGGDEYSISLRRMSD